MQSGNFKSGLNNAVGSNPKGSIATSSDYIQTTHMLQQPPFYTQANAAAGIGSGLIKPGNLTTSQQQADLKNMFQRNTMTQYEKKK